MITPLLTAASAKTIINNLHHLNNIRGLKLYYALKGQNYEIVKVIAHFAPDKIETALHSEFQRKALKKKKAKIHGASLICISGWITVPWLGPLGCQNLSLDSIGSVKIHVYLIDLWQKNIEPSQERQKGTFCLGR